MFIHKEHSINLYGGIYIKVLVSAVDISANLHLEQILKGGNIKPFGIFDTRLGNPICNPKELRIMGFIRGVLAYKKAKRAINKIVELSSKFDTVLLMDSSAINIPIARLIKSKYPNKKIIYYILPQAWAWNSGRIKYVEAFSHTLASILPFERKFYKNSVYVGHPLLDEITSFKNEVSNFNRVVFLPGSRKHEIKSLLKTFKETANKLSGDKVLVIPPNFSDEDIINIYGDISLFKVSRDSKDALLNSDFAFICSGTATLEAALIGTPFVLSYRASYIDYLIASRLIKVPYVGLANIIMHFENNCPFHEELLQYKINSSNLIKAYEKTDRHSFLKQSFALRAILKHGSSDNIKKMILNI